MKQTTFSWPVRVYYEDTDSGGVVYYANYLKFMERARTELLRILGYEQDSLQQQFGIIFAVHSAAIQYRKPARFNDCLQLETTISSLGRASLGFSQSVYLADAGDKPQSPLCEAQVKIACLNAATFSTRPIPAQMLEKIKLEYVCGR